MDHRSAVLTTAPPSAASLQTCLSVGLSKVSPLALQPAGPQVLETTLALGFPRLTLLSGDWWGRLQLYTSGIQISLLLSSQLSNVTHLRMFPLENSS